MDLKKLREQSGLSIQSVAHELEKPLVVIHNWESGYRKLVLSPIEMLLLCKMYNCSLAQLVAADKGSSECDEVEIELVLGEDGVYQ